MGADGCHGKKLTGKAFVRPLEACTDYGGKKLFLECSQSLLCAGAESM